MATKTTRLDHIYTLSEKEKETKIINSHFVETSLKQDKAHLQKQMLAKVLCS